MLPTERCYSANSAIFSNFLSMLISNERKFGFLRKFWVHLYYFLFFFFFVILFRRGRKSYNELQEFCEDTLVVAKQYLVLPGSLGERIGGLYLLYGLYYKIPCHGCKIKVTKSDWEQILQFKSEIKPHHDACYILAKLMHDRAFLHTIFDTEVRNICCVGYILEWKVGNVQIAL